MKSNADRLMFQWRDVVDASQIQCLDDSNITIHGVGYNGETPLHFAAGMGYDDLVERLVQLGADIEARSDDGYTPLLEAIQLRRFNTRDLLLKLGADPNAKTTKGLGIDDVCC